MTCPGFASAEELLAVDLTRLDSTPRDQDHNLDHTYSHVIAQASSPLTDRPLGITRSRNHGPSSFLPRWNLGNRRLSMQRS